jgi:signal transduction histidine kinase
MSDLRRKFVYFFAILTAPIVILLFSEYIISVHTYDYKISSYSDFESGGIESSLPFSEFSTQKEVRRIVTGNFTVPSEAWDDTEYVYIPFYVGQLKLSMGDEVIYNSDPDQKSRPINWIVRVFEEIPAEIEQAARADRSHVKVSFQIEQDETGLVALGNIYFGKKEDFFVPNLKHIIYYEIFRAVMLGVQSAILFLLLATGLNRGLGHEYISPIIILLYFISSSIGGLYATLPGASNFIQFSVAAGPAATICMLYLFSLVLARGLTRKVRKIFLAALLLSMLPLILILFDVLSARSYNLFFAVPFLIFGIVALSFVSASLFLKTRRVEIGLWAISSTLMASSLIYDFSARIALLDVVVFTTAMSSPAFIILVSGMFVKFILSTKTRLAEANDVLKASLARQNQELLLEFERSAMLLQEATAAHEKARLTSELHDGVLTYLAMMTVLTESGSASSLQEINKLSRYASNEIRVILEARPSDQNSMTIALGALRRQMIDPLRHLGVKVEWSTEALLDYGTINPKALMNIIRIIQEAIHNAVFRSKCSYINLMAGRHHGEYMISIVNKGGRTFSEEDRKGLGIVNMTERASTMGGRFLITPNETGATVTLYLPPQ